MEERNAECVLCRYAGEAEDLGLSFAVEEEAFGRRTEHELIPGGADVAVTNANKLLYVHLVADWHLNGRLGDAAAAFAAGLAQVCRQFLALSCTFEMQVAAMKSNRAGRRLLRKLTLSYLAQGQEASGLSRLLKTSLKASLLHLLTSRHNLIALSP